MPVVAYLSNQFPSPVEPYVVHEIRELRRRGVVVLPCSARRAGSPLDDELKLLAAETLNLQWLSPRLLMRGAGLCLRRLPQLKALLHRALLAGPEPLGKRLRALLHTWLGACYALLLQDSGVDHIHVHHGYFASWIGMVAARLLGISFSMTLHGSDLLLHPAFLDIKLKNCAFCATVSEFNRQHILDHYPDCEHRKLVLQRMGIACNSVVPVNGSRVNGTAPLLLLAVGRLHAVKDHAFLVRACRRLKDRGIHFACLVAGEGPERLPLERLIRELGLEDYVRLPGHLSSADLETHYAAADVVVLTSRSEGIPLVLMEAMAHGRPVIAPAITGIPELVIDGKTGFLYSPGSLEDFLDRVESVRNSRPALGPLRLAARQHVVEHFDREKNLAAFCDLLLARMEHRRGEQSYESPVLQQI